MERILKISLVCLLLFAGCAKQTSKVVYQIPRDKQEAAAKLVTELVARAPTGYSPGVVNEAALKTVQQVYGEPVTVKL